MLRRRALWWINGDAWMGWTTIHERRNWKKTNLIAFACTHQIDVVGHRRMIFLKIKPIANASRRSFLFLCFLQSLWSYFAESSQTYGNHNTMTKMKRYYDCAWCEILTSCGWLNSSRFLWIICCETSTYAGIEWHFECLHESLHWRWRPKPFLVSTHTHTVDAHVTNLHCGNLRDQNH